MSDDLGVGVVIRWSEVQMICIWSSWCYCHPIVSCFIKIKIGLTFLALAYPGCRGIEAVKQLSLCLNGNSSSSYMKGKVRSCSHIKRVTNMSPCEILCTYLTHIGPVLHHHILCLKYLILLFKVSHCVWMGSAFVSAKYTSSVPSTTFASPEQLFAI